MHSHQNDHARLRRVRRTAFPALSLAAAVAGLAACNADAPSAPNASAQRAAPSSVGALTTRAPKKFFVNPVSGKDTNAGSLTAPFKTLAKALSVSITGDTVNLAAGTYSKATNGEQFRHIGGGPVGVPSGVRIEGTLNSAGGNATVLVGQYGDPTVLDEVGLYLNGGAVVRNVTLQNFETGLLAWTGQQTLTHLRFASDPTPLRLVLRAQATAKSSTFILGTASSGVQVSDSARFTMDGGSITSASGTCASLQPQTGIGATGSAVVTLQNKATIKNLSGYLLMLTGASSTTLANATLGKENAANCPPLSLVYTAGTTSLRLRLNTKLFASGSVNMSGIESVSSGTLRIDTATVQGFSRAGVLAWPGKFKLAMHKGSLLQNRVGLDASAVAYLDADIGISGSTVQGNGTGIVAPNVLLRSSTITGNGTGVEVTGMAADLGRSNDPGNNVLANNSGTALTFRSTVVCCAVFATGNTWNASVQGADLAGHYPVGTTAAAVTSIQQGRNFVLPSTKVGILF